MKRKWLRWLLLGLFGVILAGGLQLPVSAAKYQHNLPKAYQGLWYGYAGKKNFRHQAGYLYNIYHFTNHNSVLQTQFVSRKPNGKVYPFETYMIPVDYRKVINRHTKKVSYIRRDRMNITLQLRRTKVKVDNRQRVSLVVKSGPLKIHLFRTPLKTHNITTAFKNAYY